MAIALLCADVTTSEQLSSQIELWCFFEKTLYFYMGVFFVMQRNNASFLMRNV